MYTHACPDKITQFHVASLLLHVPHNHCSECLSPGKPKLLPVIQDGQESPLFITEVEQLFGLPESFTDGPNLSISARRRLLGKCFCVPVIQDLLSPLKDVFWVKES